MPRSSKAHACAVTKDFISIIYSEENDNNVLKLKISKDDGQTFSSPFILDTLPDDVRIRWISIAQNSDKPSNNTARFFYAYYKRHIKRGRVNKIKWMKFNIKPESLKK